MQRRTQAWPKALGLWCDAGIGRVKGEVMSVTSRKCLASAIAILVFAAGCSTTNPYTREQQTSKVVKGSAIGAAAGAVAGLLTKGDKLENALIGAGVGAMAGGGVGYYMDVQEKKLRDQLEGTGVSVTRTGENITLNLPGNITFASNSSDLNGQFFSVLDSVAVVLKEYNKTVVEVAGHTDSTGADEYNRQLSSRRAQTVAGYLGSRGVKQARLMTVGAGESYPVASNDTEQGKQLNRRVELTIVPVTQQG
jgi:outer membrane protein OmpA-like peptidoglycan-associated protein